MTRKPIVSLLALFAVYTCIFVLVKPVFMLAYGSDASAADFFAVMWHGLAMDMSMAGYLCVLPALLLIAGIWLPRKGLAIVLKTYLAIIAALLAAIIVLDLVLYGYWGFRLDSTPLFYFFSSPLAAMASAGGWQIFGGILALAVLAVAIYVGTALVCRIPDVGLRRRWTATVLMVLLTAALFIPIRGGFTVSTMNLSRAYFSENQRLNHAAINPAFSLMYSLTHAGDFADEYRFMTDDEATAILERLNARSDSLAAAPDSLTLPRPLLGIDRPDIYLIILESFSAHLMPSLGGDSVAVQLDSIASRGLLYTDCYASSFRTDRALPAILNAFPAQPSASLTRYVDKLDRLPGLAATLRENGYATTYYYGGDVNFTNMKALLVDGGFSRIVCDRDFPLEKRRSKWGAPDGDLAGLVISELPDNSDSTPRFTAIQTSSSHEPFEVPYANPRFADSPQKNAFAYADSCLGQIVRAVEASPRGSRALFVIVPDHLGAWPRDLENPAARHHIPLVFAGPALARAGQRDATPAQQPDIIPTLLAAMNIDAAAFPFGHDLSDPTQPHYAFFSEPGMAAIVTATDTVAINPDADALILASGPDSGFMQKAVKAYLQKLYDTISIL